MRLARQLVAAVSTVLLLQSSMQGSGTLCALWHTGVHHGAVSSMEGMTGMAGEAAAPVVGHAVTDVNRGGLASEENAPGCPTRGESQPCHGPWAPGTCASMSSCAWSQGIPFEATLASVGIDPGAAGLEPLTLHSGPTFAPDIPPPRA